MRIYKPTVFDTFRCLASQCPDSCCKEWEVQVDDAAAAAYRTLPGKLGEDLRRVLRTEDGETVLTIVGGRCPMWRDDGLCRIQAELGESALCRTCREFPRLTHDYGDFVELGLELSCPEAARMLLNAPLFAQNLVMTETDAPGAADYDADAMAVLLATRETMLALLADETHSVGETLALALLYGCQAQSELDGGEAAPFDAPAALETARQLAKPGDPQAVLAVFQELEILTPRWAARLRSPAPGPWEPRHRALAAYFVRRYWLQAVSDYDLYSRVKWMLLACLVTKLLGGDLVETAQLLSKEIENDADNLDAILDAAYTCPAFSDENLLGLLLKGAC